MISPSAAMSQYSTTEEEYEDLTFVTRNVIKMKEEEQSKMQFLNKKLYYYIGAMRRLRNTNKMLKDENESLRKWISGTRKRKLGVYSEEIQKLRSKVASLETMTANVMIEKNELISMREKQEIKILRLAEDKEILQYEVKKIKEEVIETNKKLNIRQAKINELQSEMEYLERQYQEESIKSYKRYEELHHSKMSLEIEIAEYQGLLEGDNKYEDDSWEANYIYDKIEEQATNANAKKRKATLQKRRATVTSWAPFNPSKDAESLHEAMKGFGTKESVIIKILSKRTRNQRNVIAHIYRDKYNNLLIDDLEQELSGNFSKVCQCLMWKEEEVNARAIERAMEGFGTDEHMLFEILCSQNAKEIQNLKTEYRKIFDKDLENDVASETRGDIKTFLLEILKGHRSLNNGHVSFKEAQADAEILFSIPVKNWFLSNSICLEILTKRSFQHLNYLVTTFWKNYNSKELLGVIDKEITGDMKVGLETLFRFVLFSSKKFYASQSHEAMEGLGTNDQQLIYIVTTRCEIDLYDIQDEYRKLYEESMMKRIEEETSGDYKKIMVALLG